jgi:hypothetical protein
VHQIDVVESDEPPDSESEIKRFPVDSKNFPITREDEKECLSTTPPKHIIPISSRNKGFLALLLLN